MSILNKIVLFGAGALTGLVLKELLEQALPDQPFPFSYPDGVAAATQQDEEASSGHHSD